MAITKVCFKITGEYITNIVRQFWVEGEMDRAIRVMNDVIGMKDEDRMAVIQGKKKLVGDSSIGISLADDNVTECNGIKILSPEEAFANQKEKIRKAKLETKITCEIVNRDGEMISSPWGLLFVPRSLLGYKNTASGRIYFIKPLKGEVGMDTFNRFEKEYSGLVEEAKEKADDRRAAEASWRDPAQEVRNRLAAAGLNISGFDHVLDGFLNQNSDGDDKQPEPDTDLNGLNGWIAPDGKFYSCGFMGHINLAYRLGFTEGNIEKEWVKVQDVKEPKAIIPRSGSDFMHIPNDGVTQAQYDTMFSWAAKHGRAFPDDLHVRS